MLLQGDPEAPRGEVVQIEAETPSWSGLRPSRLTGIREIGEPLQRVHVFRCLKAAGSVFDLTLKLVMERIRGREELDRHFTDWRS